MESCTIKPGLFTNLPKAFFALVRQYLLECGSHAADFEGASKLALSIDLSAK
jgi:hypothetical protein